MGKATKINYKSYAEPIHTRFRFYIEPMIVWIYVITIYNPSSVAEFVVIPFLVIAWTQWRVHLWGMIGESLGDKAMGQRARPVDKLDLIDTVEVAEGEVYVLKREMNCQGKMFYGAVLTLFATLLAILVVVGFPNLLLMTFLAIIIDIIITIIIYATNAIDIFGCVQVSGLGVQISKLFFTKKRFHEHKDVTIVSSDIYFGLMRSTLYANNRRYTFIADRESTAVLYQFAELAKAGWQEPGV